MAWSYTALKDFETCARLYEWKYVFKRKDKETEHTLWGNRAHKSIEQTIKTGVPLIEGITKHTWIQQLTDTAREKGAVIKTENRVALNSSFKPVEFFAKDVWVRAVLDLTIVGEQTAFIWDWKTGKPKEDETQLQIFAGVGFKMWPQVTVINARYAWLKTGEQTRRTFTRLREFEIWEKIIPRVVRLELAVEKKEFPPRPCFACKYCPVTTCEFNERNE